MQQKIKWSQKWESGAILCGGHSALFHQTTQTQFDAYHKKFKHIQALRMVRVMAVVYVFKQKGSVFWKFLGLS
jgi:hypothetical protein